MHYSSLRTVFGYVFISLLPIQLGTYFFLPFSSISGVRIDYLAPNLYLTDMLSFFIIVLCIREIADQLKCVIKNRFIQKIAIFGGLLVLLNVSFAVAPYLALFRWGKVLQWLAIFLAFRGLNLRVERVLTIVLMSLLVQLFLTTYQVVAGSSLQGIAYWLGERAMSLSTPGVPKVVLDGKEILRGFGTFSHPNIASGFALAWYAVSLFLPMKSGVKHAVIRWGMLGTTSLMVLLSFSKMNMSVLLLLTAYWVVRQTDMCVVCRWAKMAIPAFLWSIALMTQGDPESFEKRWYLAVSALDMIKTHPLFGVGAGNYLYAQFDYPHSYPYFFLQPVHNVFLLIGAEWGGLILMTGMTLLWKTKRVLIEKIKSSKNTSAVYTLLVVVVITGLGDHYWITAQQTFLLVPIFLGVLLPRHHVVQ